MIPIHAVTVPDYRLRSLRPNLVAELARSIEQVGLLNPICVTERGLLVAGRHRLEACRSLGWEEIPHTVVDLDDLTIRLAEVDENLIRADLTALERGEHMVERKRVYELLHPEAPSGRGGDRGGANETVSFASDTAAKTGASERTVQLDVQVGSLPPEVRDAIRDTPVADRKMDLVGLARMGPEEQAETITALRDGAATLADAVRRAPRAATVCGTPHPETGHRCIEQPGHAWSHGYVEGDGRIAWRDDESGTVGSDLPEGGASNADTDETPQPDPDPPAPRRAAWFPPPTPTTPQIDLRLCDVADLLDSLPDHAAHLVIADPPWDYVQHHGATRADNHYRCLRIPQIAQHVAAASRIASRLALWVTCPLLGEWMAVETPWGAPVTSGAWLKSREGDEGAAEEWDLPEGNGHFGQGYHWAGCAELVLLYTLDGSHTDRSVPVRNAWIAGPQQHSQKPVAWMAQWIKKWVPEGGLVVDLYAGLGGVAQAVILAGGGRRYVGAEIDPDRHAEALANIARVRG